MSSAQYLATINSEKSICEKLPSCEPNKWLITPTVY